MSDSRADEIIKRQESMESQRVNWDSHWREISERILPRQDYFQRQTQTPGEKKTEKMLDATAALALDRFAAALESMLTPRTQRWHKLRATDENLNKSHRVSRYLEQVNDLLFKLRYSPRANFASQMHENYIGLGAFGTGALFVDDALGDHFRYRVLHLSELYFRENHVGIVDTVHRKFTYTARQAAQRFGEDNLPGSIRNALSSNQPDREFDFIHCVMPNSEVESDKLDRRGMPYASIYVSLTDRTIVREGGYNAFPYAVSRYVTAPREIYGRSPAMLVLPDIKQLNEMEKTTMKAAHKMVDPPMMLHEDGLLSPFSLQPGALNYGAVNNQGQQLAHPLQTTGRVDIGLEMMNQKREVINDAFLVTLFQILVETPTMTATEALLRAQEKGALLAPTMGRQQSEMLGPMIEREIDMAANAGLLPEMPEELIEAGAEIEIEYDSPLSRLVRAEDGVAIVRTLESLSPLAQIKPEVLDIFDPELTARELADVNGVPAKVLRSPEMLRALEQQRAQQQQAAALLEAAPVAGQVAKDMSQAQSTARSAPF